MWESTPIRRIGKITEWARRYYDALHAFGAGWAYLNFMKEEGEGRIRASYRGNYERLAKSANSV